jgi:hypothetical protein
MTNAISNKIRLGSRSKSACGCDFLAAGMEQEVHDQLAGLELLTAIEAVEICGELAVDGLEAGEFTAFVAAHSFYSQARMARLAVLLDDLAAGCNSRSRSTVSVDKNGKVRVRVG